ncbi:hypothetical protein ABZ671_31385 [Micromonospora sp. NPDC006766]|uniref:hypothetical protein n=1 Tax=Micromonospora sp. NPDC006766 TaxID=3154778 RepID=UPI00340F1368
MTMKAPARGGATALLLGFSMLLYACGEGTDGSNSPQAGSTSATSFSPSPSPTQSPTAFRVGEQAACIELFPHLQAAADLVTAISKKPDGSTVDQDKLDSTIAALDHVIDVAPVDMVPALQEQVGPLRDLQAIFNTGQNRKLNFENFRSSGIDLVTRCGKHAEG